MPKPTIDKRFVPLQCEYCNITYNVATRYKVLSCSKSIKFNKVHSFKEIRKLIEVRKQ